MAMLVHIWKALPFWTLILIAGRLAIPKELYEAASVDGATGWQKFKFITWPSMRTLYLTSTHPVDDLDAGRLQQRLPADRRRPADLTHVLATLGIRYLRLDQVDHAMATIVVRAAARAAAGLLHDEAAVRVTNRRTSQRSEAAADRHPGPALDADPDLPHLPVLDLDQGLGVLGPAVARPPDAAQLRDRVPAGALLPAPLLAADLELAAGSRSRSARSRCSSPPPRHSRSAG